MRAPDFWNHRHGRRAAVLTRSLLLPFSWIYAAVSNWRYNKIRPQRMSVPVICVGNVTLGGTGKTPVAMALAKKLIAQGKKPAFVSRGYGGKLSGPLVVDLKNHSYHQVGDEPLLLAKIAPTFVGRDRVAAAKLAVQANADCLILDDGFQNPSIQKDISLLVIDAGVGHGNGQVFPAGPLREPIKLAMKRADIVVMIGAGKDVDLAGFDGPVLHANLQPSAQAPKGKLIAFAGIGRPEKFFGSLRAAGAKLEQEISFADHHPYTETDVQNLLQWAKQSGAKLITTEKDLMRWPQQCRDQVLVWPVDLVFAAPQDMEILMQGILAKCP